MLDLAHDQHRSRGAARAVGLHVCGSGTEPERIKNHHQNFISVCAAGHAEGCATGSGYRLANHCGGRNAHRWHWPKARMTCSTAKP